jgi:hypothetical protein
MREASLKHFELALEARNWRQAREKLEQARQVGLGEAEYGEKAERLKAAEIARERQIRERVEALMADAQRVKRETPHEMAVSEVITLKDRETTRLLLPYAADANQWCQVLAMDVLAWMGEPEAAKAILPFIGGARPDGRDTTPGPAPSGNSATLTAPSGTATRSWSWSR